MNLQIILDTRDGWRVVACSGELDVYTSPRLKQTLRAALEVGERRIALDLSGLTYCDSTGLGVCLWLRKWLAEHDGAVIVRLSPYLARQFMVTGLDRLFSLAAPGDPRFTAPEVTPCRP